MLGCTAGRAGRGRRHLTLNPNPKCKRKQKQLPTSAVDCSRHFNRGGWYQRQEHSSIAYTRHQALLPAIGAYLHIPGGHGLKQRNRFVWLLALRRLQSQRRKRMWWGGKD